MPKWTAEVEFTFDAAHKIDDYDGPCGRLHGHTYRVRLWASTNELVSSEYCPHPVMVSDFRTLKWAKKDVSKGGLDHCYLNDVMPYATTAECIAQYIHEETQKRVGDSIKLKVSVSETPNSWVVYEN